MCVSVWDEGVKDVCGVKAAEVSLPNPGGWREGDPASGEWSLVLAMP